MMYQESVGEEIQIRKISVKKFRRRFYPCISYRKNRKKQIWIKHELI